MVSEMRCLVILRRPAWYWYGPSWFEDREIVVIDPRGLYLGILEIPRCLPHPRVLCRSAWG
jgi:hypothetical protein